jgi:hypothetical protein
MVLSYWHSKPDTLMRFTYRHVFVLISVASLAVAALPANAQERRGANDSTFLWTGRMAPGTTLRVHNFNGPMVAVMSTDENAEVRAVKRGRYRSDRIERSDRYSDIEFETRKLGNDILICALRPDDDCDEDGISTHGDSDRNGRNQRAEFSIKVPKGVKLQIVTGNGEIETVGTGAGVVARSGNGAVHVDAHGDGVTASSGNGDVEVLGAGAPVNAHSGNGHIEVTTTLGPVQATSGNGNIDVEIGSLKTQENMSFRSGNGRISLTLPGDYNGELESSTGNGHLISDFPLSVEGRLDRQRVRATIGKGGPRLRMSSGNGNIVLRKKR